jgi:hypothetical protein
VSSARAARASSIATSAACLASAAPVTGARIFSGPVTGSLSWTPRAIATAKGPSNERADLAKSGAEEERSGEPPVGVRDERRRRCYVQARSRRERNRDPSERNA